jgi:hypothetical protein
MLPDWHLLYPGAISSSAVPTSARRLPRGMMPTSHIKRPRKYRSRDSSPRPANGDRIGGSVFRREPDFLLVVPAGGLVPALEVDLLLAAEIAGGQ